MTERLSFTIAEAAHLTGVCRTNLYQEISKGRLRSVKIGRSTRLLIGDIRNWLDSLPSSRVSTIDG